jgi:hypothetical protein
VNSASCQKYLPCQLADGRFHALKECPIFRPRAQEKKKYDAVYDARGGGRSIGIGRKSLDRNSPTPREVEPSSLGDVIAIPQVGGLHHRYTRAA